MATVLSFYLYKVRKLPMQTAFLIGIPIGFSLDMGLVIVINKIVKAMFAL